LTARAALAGSLALGLASVGASAPSATELYEPAPPKPGTEIPSATVNFGMRPYADNTFCVIAMKQGGFEDVGITIGRRNAASKSPTPT
jgi:ABC-type nitrate/sulfonate/bicarbonate transport system substrate-binding protein